MSIGSSSYSTDKNEIKRILQNNFDITRRGRGEYLISEDKTVLVSMKLAAKAFNEMRQENPDREQMAGIARRLKELELQANPDKIKLSKDGTKIKAKGLWNKHFSSAVSRAKAFNKAEIALSKPDFLPPLRLAAKNLDLTHLHKQGFGVKFYKTLADLGNAKGVPSAKALAKPDFLPSLRLAAKNHDPQAEFDLAYLYEQGFGVNQDLDKALKGYKLSAEHGNVLAQNKMGEIYHHPPDGMKQNIDKAEKYYQLAAKQGNADSQYGLGVIYTYFRGNVSGHQKTAEDFYALAAKQGRTEALTPGTHLGSLYARGEGVPKDLGKAFELYQLGTLSGDPESQRLLADMYLQKKNTDKAIEYYTLAANQGDFKASYQLGMIYEKTDAKLARQWYFVAAEQSQDPKMYLKLAEDFRRDKDWKMALYCYASAEEIGDPEAYFQLARLHETGVGVDRKDIKLAIYFYEKAAAKDHLKALHNLGAHYESKNDLDQAFEYYKKAAKLGDVASQFRLGKIYKKWDDFDKAEKYYRMAADRGDSSAQTNLGNIFAEEGQFSEALKWFRLAAKQNDPVALFNLGTFYEDGNGVEIDLKKALNYYREAVKFGDEESKAEVERLEKLL